MILDKDSVALFENGIILGKYMSFMKDILVISIFKLILFRDKEIKISILINRKLLN